MEEQIWRKCSSCKKPILFNKTYYVCSVSTCNGERTGYVFCSVPCFDSHIPGARHKDAGAIEKKAPPPAAPVGGNRIIVKSPAASQASPAAQTSQDVLVIASRLKDYISNRSEFNTSGSVMDVLSTHLRFLCDRAIENARADGRKTVMDRDFEFLRSLK
jgi:histone H3/H4